MRTIENHSNRRGGVYLAVLGTAMIAGVLAFSALALQRVQNRMLSSSSEVRQAQLNAEAAIGMGLLTVKSDPAWRTNNPNGQWFANRNIGDGGCALSVVDPLDGDLTDNPSEPIVLTGIGASGNAVQRIVKTVDVYPEPLECLRSSVAAGGNISLSGATLRATNAGLITANAVSASSSDVYGRVQAANVSGGTYRNTTTQVAAADLPTMPDWSTVFDYYQDNGTEIPIGSVPSSLGNFERNGNFQSNDNYWYGNPPGVAPATVARSTTTGKASSPPGCLLVSNRGNWNSGACQSIAGYVKAGHTYLISAHVALSPNVPIATKVFRVRLTTKGTESAEVHVNSADSPPITGSSFLTFPPTPISAIVTAPAWSGDLEYAFIKFAFSDSSSSPPYYDFHIDDVVVTDVTVGKFIYRQVLGPNVNSMTLDVNSEGLYWINCAGQDLVIERSRIKGTLLLVNPGSGSMIGPGPIQWSPAKPGYPALLVDADIPSNADFRIEATNRTLSEPEDGRQYNPDNPAGMSHASLGSDADMNDTFPSEIEGLIVVRDDLTFKNRTLVRGSVIVGDQINSTGGSLEVEYRPDSLYSPPPGFESTSKHVERPLSVHKEVLP
jgi:hypothetical protein